MSPTNSREQHEQYLGEMLLLGLLGRLIYQYPDREQREWFQELTEPDTFLEAPLYTDQQDIADGLELLQAWASQGLDDDTYLEMQADFTRLFIGVGKVIAAPWESVYFNEDRLTFEEETLQVRQWFRRFGLEAEKLFNEPDDHIGLELTFLANLTSQALEALDGEDTEKFGSLIQARNEFLTEHLLKWGFRWCDLVTENARTDFYKGIGLLTRGTLHYLAATYELPIDQSEVVG